MSSKRYGLLLTLEGAPATPHVLAGLPGHFRPGVPRPVGGDGDALTLDQAKTAVKERKDVLELVEITSTNFTVAEAEKLAEQDAKAARAQLRDAAAVADGAEVSRVEDETKAVK